MSDERDWLATNDPVLSILTDLIAELRDMGGEYDSGWAPLIPVADRAEARLREVQGE